VAALPQPRLTAGELLEADRRDRDGALLGRHADTVDDVHASCQRRGARLRPRLPRLRRPATSAPTRRLVALALTSR
jgi:hypothetical protein